MPVFRMDTLGQTPSYVRWWEDERHRGSPHSPIEAELFQGLDEAMVDIESIIHSLSLVAPIIDLASRLRVLTFERDRDITLMGATMAGRDATFVVRDATIF